MEISDWITALATLSLAVLTFVYVKLTKSILECSMKPCVTITVIPDDRFGRIMYLLVRNIGQGVAYDIRFSFTRNNLNIIKDKTNLNSNYFDVFCKGILVDGIPVLGPGETRKIRWGQYIALKETLNDIPVIAVCKFKKDKKYMPPITSPLEVNSFWGTSLSRNPVHTVSSELEKINNNIRLLTTGIQSINASINSLPKDMQHIVFSNESKTMQKIIK